MENPYKSPSTVPDPGRRRRTLAVPLARSLGNAFVGAILGYFGAGLLWDFFYSIGSSVISDEVWFEHGQSVSAAGLAAGAATALIASLLIQRWATLVVLAQHVAAVLAGGMAAAAGARWPGALGVYLGTQLLVALGACVLLRQVKTPS